MEHCELLEPRHIPISREFFSSKSLGIAVFCAPPTTSFSDFYFFTPSSVASHKEIVPILIYSVVRPRKDLHSVESWTRSDQQQLSVCTSVHHTTGHDRRSDTKIPGQDSDPASTSRQKQIQKYQDQPQIPHSKETVLARNYLIFAKQVSKMCPGEETGQLHKINLDKRLGMFMWDMSTWNCRCDERSIILYQI